MARTVKHLTYPAHDWAGIVWAYMGPRDTMLDVKPLRRAPNEQVRVAIIPCDRAQILEGAIDSAHSSSLHSSDLVRRRIKIATATPNTWPRPSTDAAPRLQFAPHPMDFAMWRCAPHLQCLRQQLCMPYDLRGAGQVLGDMPPNSIVGRTSNREFDSKQVLQQLWPFK